MAYSEVIRPSRIAAVRLREVVFASVIQFHLDGKSDNRTYAVLVSCPGDFVGSAPRADRPQD